MAERYLIVNADDFGMSESANGAIVELFEGEKIGSAGILAPAPFAGEAAAVSGQRGYSIGVHWTLTSEWAAWPWAPCGDCPSLLEEGVLTADKQKVKQAKRRDITRELEAQYLRLLDMGCVPDHADSHAGTLYGTNGRLFFLNAYALCKKYGLPFRFATEDSFLTRQFGGNVSPALKLAAKAIGGVGKLRGVKLLSDFCSDPRPVEKIGGPSELRAYYEAQLSTLQGRICEVFMHPCLPDEELLSRSPQWQKRVWEYEYLKSGDLILAAREAGFRVVSWREAFI
jgi:predicted glycoside hydrolase/deacetylase ChbG (UPF0249 family)